MNELLERSDFVWLLGLIAGFNLIFDLFIFTFVIRNKADEFFVGMELFQSYLGGILLRLLL